MRIRSIFAMLLAALLLLSTAGCGQTETPTPPPQSGQPASDGSTIEPTAAPSIEPSTEPTTEATTEPSAEPSTEPTAEPAANPVGGEDTFWVAYEWYSEDGEGAEGPRPIDPDEWYLDLIVRADGTARFRDIHDGLYLVEDADLRMTWEQAADGTLSFYNEIYLVPELTGKWEDGILTLDYRGVLLSMEQAPMPESVGELYSPAELVGTWIMVRDEAGDANISQLMSFVFGVTSTAESITLDADWEGRDSDGTLLEGFFGAELTILDEPLFEGCGNDVWSVQLDTSRAAGDKGYGFVVTMTDRDTLLAQWYDSSDGTRSGGYRTYKRIPPKLSWWDVEEIELIDTHWECVGYFDLDGAALPMPEELDGFYLHLASDSECWMGIQGEGDAASVTAEGSWLIANGGVVLVRGEDYDGEYFWYFGGVRGYGYENVYEYIDDYEMLLLYKGGLMLLDFTGYG